MKTSSIIIPAAVALLALTACSTDADADTAEPVDAPTAETTDAAEVEETEAEPEIAATSEFAFSSVESADLYMITTEWAEEIVIDADGTGNSHAGKYASSAMYETVTVRADSSCEDGFAATFAPGPAFDGYAARVADRLAETDNPVPYTPDDTVQSIIDADGGEICTDEYVDLPYAEGGDSLQLLSFAGVVLEADEDTGAVRIVDAYLD